MRRECGTCSACCRWPSIPELNKPRGVACSRLGIIGYGCAQYADRPKSCSDYQCSWIEGNGALEDNPHESGVLIDRRKTQFGIVLIARDYHLDMPPEPKMRAIQRISRDLGLPCLLIEHDDPQKIVQVRGPRHLVDKLVAEYPELAEKVA